MSHSVRTCAARGRSRVRAVGGAGLPLAFYFYFLLFHFNAISALSLSLSLIFIDGFRLMLWKFYLSNKQFRFSLCIFQCVFPVFPLSLCVCVCVCLCRLCTAWAGSRRCCWSSTAEDASKLSVSWELCRVSRVPASSLAWWTMIKRIFMFFLHFVHNDGFLFALH